MPHPLDPLTANEITVAITAAKQRLTDAARFSTVTLDEPAKGEQRPRRAHLVIVPGHECIVVEASIDVTTGEIARWHEHANTRPALGFEESFTTILALIEDPRFIDALATRGINKDQFDKLQIDPWPTGNFDNALEAGRRVQRCITYLRDNPTDNGYARPVEGIVAWVDGASGEVLDVHDYGVVPIPVDKGSYYPEDHDLRTDLKPLEIIQPEGVSYTLDGRVLTWQKWSLHVSMNPLEGLVISEVAYEGRSIMHRASICEMVVPYGDPGPMHGWKNAFDAGEWGLGRMANTLTLGCDCLGEILYLDFDYADEHGNPTKTENAICIHEEDYGILWKHVDLNGGRTEVRRSRRLVVSFIATVGNYEYGFYWYFYMDGSIQHEVKLTGIMSTKATVPGEPHSPFTPPIAPGLAAPVHQHLFCARLDMDVDGPGNAVYEVNVDPEPAGDDNPWGNAFLPTATLLASESAAQRNVDPARSRTWKIANPNVTNAIGEPVAYKLIPGASPTLLGSPGSSIAKRAAFATNNLWVTPYASDEKRAAGDYPNQHEGGDGLPAWTAADRSLVDTDVVLWHSFGVTHIPRPEDWPVMPVEYCGFQLIPVGFFDRNPALDVPPSPEKHCH